MSDKQDSKSFWTTVPGFLTGCAALLTALGGLITALYAAGLLQTIFPSSVATPTATSIRPTATLVSLTQAVVTVTSSPQPTVPMTPTQPCPTPQFFENVWRAHPQLGCPVNSLTSDFVFRSLKEALWFGRKAQALQRFMRSSTMVSGKSNQTLHHTQLVQRHR